MAENKMAADALVENISRKLKVCGHPVRLKLLCLIHRQLEPCVTNLWTCLGQSQPVISQHLAVLKENGVVDSSVSGNKRIYTISDDFIRELVEKMIAENKEINRHILETNKTVKTDETARNP